MLSSQIASIRWLAALRRIRFSLATVLSVTATVGIALGIDRVVMLFAGLENIRDCIAFPKTQKATDLMTEAPGTVDRTQLQELGIQLQKVAGK